MASVIRWLFSFGKKLLGFLGISIADGAARGLWLKGALLFLFISVLPVVLNNLIYSLLNTFMTKAASASTAFNAGSSPVLQFTGLGAYLASQLGIPEATSIVMSALAIGATLRILKLN